jgi:hypothetical protein
VPALGEQPEQPESDLAVPASDDDVHAGHRTPHPSRASMWPDVVIGSGRPAAGFARS